MDPGMCAGEDFGGGNKDSEGAAGPGLGCDVQFPRAQMGPWQLR
jgi:hypothetical protein